MQPHKGVIAFIEHREVTPIKYAYPCPSVQAGEEPDIGARVPFPCTVGNCGMGAEGKVPPPLPWLRQPPPAPWPVAFRG